MRFRLLTILILLNSSTAVADQGWLLKRQLNIDLAGFPPSSEVRTLRATSTGARLDADGRSTIVTWASDDESNLDHGARKWHRADAAARKGAVDLARGMLAGAAGIETLSETPSSVEAMDEPRAIAGWACEGFVIRDAPLVGITTTAWVSTQAVPEAWRGRLLRAELGGSSTPPALPFQAVAELPGYPVLIEIDISSRRLKGTIRLPLQKVKQTKIKRDPTTIPSSYAEGLDPARELEQSMERLDEAITSPPIEGSEGLHLAAQVGDLDEVERLLDAGADVDARGVIDSTPLYLAAWKGQVKSIALLLERGARMDVTSNGGFLPLHAAAARNHPDAVRTLVAAARTSMPRARRTKPPCTRQPSVVRRAPCWPSSSSAPT